MRLCHRLFAVPVSFKQTSSGRIVGTDSSYAPETPVHRDILLGRQEFPNAELRSMHGRRILDRIATLLPGARGAPLQRLTLGFRPLPKDGFPIVGYIPGSDHVYIAVTHSGVTLAAIMGQLIRREILDGLPSAAFAPYRPQRFSDLALQLAYPGLLRVPVPVSPLLKDLAQFIKDFIRINDDFPPFRFSSGSIVYSVSHSG